MYRRMYGTAHFIPGYRKLEPLGSGPWLQVKSIAPTVKWALGGTGSCILLLLLLFPFGKMGYVPEAIGIILFLLSGFGVMISLFLLSLLWIERSSRDLHQYCPDCLSYMTRGAKVCPFCGFRPEPVRNAWQG